MTSNLDGEQSGGGDPPPGMARSRKPPPEKTRTQQELEMIHAAMMEELGIGRKDTLPLEDKGYEGPINHLKPLKREVPDDPNDPTAAWRNFKPDDIDPADAQLDSIADGQLYRLRRGLSSNGRQRGFAGRGGSPGRGRGGFANRGSHSYTGGRGESVRGGHDQGPSGNRGPFSGSSPTPRSYFNDARRSVRKHAQIDAAIARLRAIPDEPLKKSRVQNSGPQPMASGQRAAPSWNLVSAETFLAHTGFKHPVDPQPTPQPTALTSSSQLSNTISTGENPRPVGQTPSTAVGTPRQNQTRAPLASSTPQAPFQSQQQNKPQFNSTELSLATVKVGPRQSLLKGEVGLASSRWASSSDRASTPISNPVVSSTSSRTPVASSNGKLPPTSHPPVNPPVSHQTLVASSENKVAAAASHLSVQLPASSQIPVLQPIQTIFRDSGAVKIRKNGGDIRRGFARILKNSADDEYYLFEIKVDNAVVVSEEIYDDATWRADGVILKYQANLASPKWEVTFPIPHQLIFFGNIVGHAMKGRSRPVREQTAATHSPSVPRVGNINASNPPQFTQPQGAATQPDFQSAFARPGTGTRISSRSFTEMNEVAGLVPLISLDEDEYDTATEATGTSYRLEQWVQDLINMDDAVLLEKAVSYYESRPEGSFIDQMSGMVTRNGGVPAADLTGVEILNSQEYQQAAEILMGNFLSTSETFSRLPDMVHIHFAMEKGRKLLQIYVAKGDGLRPTTAIDARPRITYLIDDLFSLRKNASIFRRELIAEDLAHLVNEPPTPIISDPLPVINPANVIRTTRLGRPIVAGAQELSSESHNSRPQPGSSIPEWQSFASGTAEAQSEVSSQILSTSRTQEVIATQQNVTSQLDSSSNSGTSGLTANIPVKSPIAKDRVVDMRLFNAMLESIREADIAPLQEETKHAVYKASQLSSIGINVFDKKPSPPEVQANLEIIKSEIPGPQSIRLDFVEDQPISTHTEFLPKPFSQEIPRHHLSGFFPVRERKSDPGPSTQDSSSEKPSRDLHLSNRQAVQQPSTSPVTATLATGHIIPQNMATIQAVAPVRTSSPAGEALSQKIMTALELSSRPLSDSRSKSVSAIANRSLQGISEHLSPSQLEMKAEQLLTDVLVSRIPSSAVLSKSESLSNIDNPQSRALVNSEPESKIENVSNPSYVVSANFESRQKIEAAKATEDIQKTPCLRPALSISVPSTTADAVAMQPLPLASESKAENLKKFGDLPAAQQPTVKEKTLPVFENASNKDLKGAPGLKASKWASDAAPQYISVPKPEAPHFQPLGPQFHPTFQPAHPYAPSKPPFSPTIFSPPPAMAQFVAPVMQTILYPDPYTGQLTEMTGYVKSGTVPMPVVQHAVLQPITGPPRSQENDPNQSTVASPNPSFPPRPSMYSRHLSNESSDSESFFKPMAASFIPSRGRNENSGSAPASRPALSPVRKGENVQAKLQSRLSNSLAERSGNSPNGHA